MTDNSDTNVRLSLMPHVLRLFLLMALIGCFPAYARTQPATFPGADWIQTTPEAQGVDSAKLQGAVEFLRANAPSDGVNELVIIRYLIWKGTGIDKRHEIWSCTKSFTSTILGLLVDDGKTTLDTKTATVLSSMSAAYPDVTFRHFTTMTSGYFAVGDDLSTHGRGGGGPCDG